MPFNFLALGRVLVGSTIVASQTCPDKLLPNAGVADGNGILALTNASTLGECCALCHGDYHDECVAWVFGRTRQEGLGIRSHTCAILASAGKPRTVAGHTSGIAGPNPPAPPSPAPGPPCHADTDCNVMHGDLWRCQHDAAAALPAGNCHLPGPGTRGNSTCSCASIGCLPASYRDNKTASVQYLMIGDSISLGMRSDLSAIVAQRGWSLTHNPGNAASSNLGMHCLEEWITPDRTWNIISFNFGLHDLGFDTERISVEQYTELIKNITSRLVAVQKKTGCKLLWVDTTPVPTVSVYGPSCNDTSRCLNPPRFDADVVLYNAAAAEVMADANAAGAQIETADLYSFVLVRCGGKGFAHCDGFQLPMNVHYTAEGWAALAKELSSILFKTMDETGRAT